MITSRELINDIKALQGATVNYFGDSHKLNNEVSSDDLTINTIDILEALDSFEAGSEWFETYNEDSDEFETPNEIADAWGADSWDVDFELMDTLQGYGFIGKELRADNTYNWGAPVNHHFDYRIYENCNGGIFVFLQVHRFGDVRGNYAGFTLYHFDSIDCFYDVMCDNGSKYVSIDIDGDLYDVELSVFSDTYEVCHNGDYITDAWGDLDDVSAKIREFIA